MESHGHATRARPGKRQVDRVAATAAGPSRLLVRRRRGCHSRPGGAACGGRRLRLGELRRARGREDIVMTRRLRALIAVAALAIASSSIRAQEQPDRTLPAQLSAPTRATLA